MVPNALKDWTYEAIRDLCAAGQSESDRHDFKFNLAALNNATKICCAFANSFGGFIIVGVKETALGHFEIIGIDPDPELYGNFLAKVKAEPDIGISPPKTISVPNTSKLLYVIEVTQSARRPHLPSPTDQRVFWKRQGPNCVQMTLEEIRYQMNTYEEKREKLVLLLIDLHNKLQSLAAQTALPDGQYDGDVYSFDIIDRVVSETFSILKSDVSIFGALDTLKRRLMLLNAEKQKLLSILSQSYALEFKIAKTNEYRQVARNVIPDVTILAEQIERALKEKIGITNPYKATNSSN
jgi:hypothetical protein